MAADAKHQRIAASHEKGQAVLDELNALSGQRVLVTGGCGFLGRHIVEKLLEFKAKVRVFDVVEIKYSDQVEFVKGSLTTLKEIVDACRDIDVVIHVASPSPLSKNKQLFFDVNVTGSENVIQACLTNKITRLVYTSSASIVFDGGDQKNLDEQDPPPRVPLDDYTWSKQLAEEKILAVKQKTDQLAVCALRPHGIFGPRDPHMLPALSRSGLGGKNKFMIGDGSNLVDFTYVENVAYAHALAAVKLSVGSPMNGKAYFITNREPVLFWDFLSSLYEGMGYSKPFLTVPFRFMLAMATLLELIGRFLPLKLTFTKQAVTYAGRHHYYNSERSERDFDFFPPISLRDGIDRTVQSCKELHAPAHLRNRSTAHVSVILSVVAATVLGVVTVLVGRWLAFTSLWQYLALAFTPLALRFLNKFFGARPIPFKETVDLTNKIVVITGGNKGIGLAAAKAFAALKATVVVACRHKQRAEDAVKDILASAPGARVHYLLVDFSSLKTVAEFPAAFVAKFGDKARISYLINNAGLMPPKSTTLDGFDEQVQVNYLAHFLLTTRLLEQNLIAADGRIVQLSSLLHEHGRVDFTDFNCQKSYVASKVYANTKLMNVLFAFELNRRLVREGSMIRVVALHPGAVETEFMHHFAPVWLLNAARSLLSLFLITAEQSAYSIVYAAASREMRGVGGQYIAFSAVERAADSARNDKLAAELYDYTDNLLQKFKK